jgi:integrase
VPAPPARTNPEAIMHHFPAWTIEPTRILSRRELGAVLADLKRQAPRSANARRNLIIVRLACCCGLRVSEIAGLQLDDVLVDLVRPHLRLRRETTKGKRPRRVPLWHKVRAAPTRHFERTARL